MSSVLVMTAGTCMVLCFVVQPGVAVDFPNSLEFVTATLEAIHCLVRDQFNDDLTALVCSRHEIYRLHLTNMDKSLIAGNEYFSGYAEGIGNSARFRSPRDIVQFNASTLLVSDGLNHCLRSITSQTTSTFAGLCETTGFTNGDLTNSRFYWPYGLLKLDRRLYVSDQYNNAVRLIDLDNKQVSTFLQLNVANPVHPPFPKRLACVLGHSCDKMYLTFEHGVKSVNLITGLSQLVAGGTGTGVSGPSGNSIRETEFTAPDALLFLDHQQLFIAENRNNGKYFSLNFTSSRSQSHSGISGESITSVLCAGNFIFLGVRSGLYRMVFNEDLPCSELTMDAMEGARTTSDSPTIPSTTKIPTRPTTATVTEPSTSPATTSTISTLTQSHDQTVQSTSRNNAANTISAITSSDASQSIQPSTQGSINDRPNVGCRYATDSVNIFLSFYVVQALI